MVSNLAKAVLEDTGRESIQDKKFVQDTSNEKFINKQFIRVVAQKFKFTEVDFRYCTFDSAYFRNCKFDSCNFTGCRFVNSNLLGSAFSGCVFDYAIFEKTLIDDDILDNNCPGAENLKLKFARSLRLNYQQLGDAISANKAIGIELQATEDHLYKSWQSKESYYRKKYQGLKRANEFIKWAEFKALDFIWGNGENPLKLLRTVVFSLVSIAIFHVIMTGNSNHIGDYIDALLLSPQILLGVVNPVTYPTSLMTIIIVARLILFGLFMSIIIKRFNRR